MEKSAYIRRETGVSIGINTALSALFFLLVFGRSGTVAVWGQRGYVIDFGPQGFMIGLMSVLVPGLLARKALAAGKIVGVETASTPLRRTGVRAVVWAVSGAALGVIGSAALFSLISLSQFAWLPALLVKLAFGAGLAAIATPAGLRAELTQNS